MKFLTLVLCLWLSLCYVGCDEQPIELSANTDLKKLSAAESKVTESVADQSKDGDTLDAAPSLQNPQQTDYNYVVSNKQPNQPLSIDLGPYNTGPDQSGAQQSYGSQSGKPQSIIYRYTTNSDGSVGPADPPSQQQQPTSYIRTEPQHSIFEQKTYVRQAALEDRPASASGYKLPELTGTAPGVSRTFTSPEVKIVSHTRSFLPTVYNKDPDEPLAGAGGQRGDQQSNSEQEYDKAVEDRPGGNYAQEQGDQYDNDSNEGQDDRDQTGPAQSSYDQSNSLGYRQNEDRVPAGVGEVLSRGPYYNIHKPIAAHVQVIEDKDEYRVEAKNNLDRPDRQPSYGLRTQPRPQFKNYQPSGYKPGMMSAFDPPSPPMSSFLPPMPNQGNSQSDSEADDEESYNNRDLSARPQRLPEPQALHHQQQHQQHQQRPAGVEIEFDQGNRNEPHVVRGPPGYRPGPEQGSSDGQFNQGGANEDYDNNNHLGPKYNVEGDEPASGRPHNFKIGRPQQAQLLKPQEIEYGFIPLSEAKDILEGGPMRGPYDEQRGQENRPNRPDLNRPERPMRPNERPNGFGPEGYRGPRQHGQEGPRRPHQTLGDAMTVSMYGRGQQGQAQEGPRRPQFNNNEYREQPMGPLAGPFRRPQFDRPHFPKNQGGQEQANFMQAGVGDMPNGDEEEEGVDEGEGDYGKQRNGANPVDKGSAEGSIGPSDPDKLPYECYPWNCNPWHAVHPDSPYNSPIGIPLKGRGPHGSGLPPGASYNPRDVGLDDAVIAQLNLAASGPQGMVPGGGVAPAIVPPSFRGTMHGSPTLDIPFSGSRPFPGVAAPGVPKPRPVPYSASGQGFRSQYGYRAAAASELSPVSAAQTSGPAAAGGNSLIANLLNQNPVKSFRSLMSYITGGING